MSFDGRTTPQWVTATITAPYTAVAGFEPKYLIDSAGTVHLRGRVNKNAAGDGDPCLTLDAGYRPSTGVQYVVDTSPATTSSGRVMVETDGEVRPYLKTGAPTMFILDTSFTVL